MEKAMTEEQIHQIPRIIIGKFGKIEKKNIFKNNTKNEKRKSKKANKTEAMKEMKIGRAHV
jgi:hypothetical protein